MLIGRRTERDALERLLREARDGRSGVLVLRGEPGVGKTALVEYAVESASDFRVARAVGVESEAELAFAVLHQLCSPMFDRLERLPEPQRNAMGVAFGLSAGAVPERFLVGLAALSLLSDAAQEQPLLCIVDDAQWLDRASAQALAFVARRALADPVALIFATRAGEDDLAALPELVIDGLNEDDARLLLASAVKGPLDERVRDRIVAETGGNPLALLELPRGLSAAELAMGFGRGEMLPLSGRIEETFRRRVEELPEQARLLLLVASAEQPGDPATVWDAADRLGISAEAAGPATDTGLLEIGERVRFRHPLVRSAVYRAAVPQQRRAVHKALAEATSPEADPDRRAWHLAAATLRPNAGVAAELERSAGRAQVRGGIAAAAAFMERSAELTLDSQQRAVRFLLAAGAYLVAGANQRAQASLEQSVPNLTDPAPRAQALRMEGAIRFADGRGGETPALLFKAATALRDLDRRLARETLLEALEAAMWAAELTSETTLRDVADAARATPAKSNGEQTTASLLLTGYEHRFNDDFAGAVDSWRRAVARYPDELGVDPRLQWQGMVWNVTGEMLDFEANIATAREWVRLARDQGALATLPVALSGLAWNEVLRGRIESAEALYAEAGEITRATGAPAVPGASEIVMLGILAWRGLAEEARALGDAVIAEARTRGQGLGVTTVHYGLTILELGLGRYEAARKHALAVFEPNALYFGSLNLADVVEATARAGDDEHARAALDRLTERATASGTPLGLGLLARARALLADDEEAETLYAESLGHLERSGVATELARAHLLYGEWLRRQRRRRDARVQLREAHEMFVAMGGEAFAHRASVELLATGERARTRTVETREQLTPQERQVAALAAEGDSNAAIAAQLFISPHTVAYHLRKVYVKLGIGSRSQLAAAIGGQAGNELERAAPLE